MSTKRTVGDLRESPSLEILEILLAKGARADYSDPYFPHLPAVRRHALNIESVPLTEETVRLYDAVVVATDHSVFPYEMIHNAASLIVNSSNAFRQRGFTGIHVIGA